MDKLVDHNWICSRCHANTGDLFYVEGKKLCRECKEQEEAESKK